MAETEVTKSGRILIVDDERSLRELLAITLEREGFEVVTAESGDEGIRRL
jgi:DNA-binding response OmpR family regulator